VVGLVLKTGKQAVTFNVRTPFDILSVLCCASAALTLCSRPAQAEQPPAATVSPAAQQAYAMIQALSSDSYSMRLHARTALFQLGRGAIEPLERAAQDEDPEVRLRAAELLIALRGRGFMGIVLQETEPPDDDDAEGAVPQRTVTRPAVTAMQVMTRPQNTPAPMNAWGIAYAGNKPMPAEAAGIQPGDKILEVNDRPITGVKDLMREVIAVGPARVALLLVDRGGKRLRVPMILTRNPVISKNNGLEYLQMHDPPPPVDLEKEEELKNLPQRTQSTRRWGKDEG
jgi:hypothetical protein